MPTNNYILVMKLPIYVMSIVVTSTGCKVNDCIDFIAPQERIQVQQVTDTFRIESSNLVYLDTTICPPGDTQATIIKVVTKTIPGQVLYRTRTDTVSVQRLIYRPQIKEKSINRHLLIAAFLAGTLFAVIIAVARHVWQSI